MPAGATTAAATAAPATGSPQLRGALTVFAAASLTAAFKELGALLQQANPGSTITFNFGGSPTLRTQLAQGAHADVFASADEPNMQGAQKDGSIHGTASIFAQNKLTVIVPAANPAGISKLQDLAKPGVKLDLAEPAVPVGNYARQAFAKMAHDPSFGSGFADAVAKEVVSNESDVKQVVAKVQLGEADAGVVYQTDVTASVRSAIKQIAIPDPFNIIAQYPIAVVNGAPNAEGAQTFISFVLSPAGQAVLAKYGFAPPPASGATTATAASTSSAAGAASGGGGVALGGLVQHPTKLTVASLQQLPQEMVTASFLSGSGTEQHNFTGVRLASVLQQAGVRLNPKIKNDQLRHYVVATGRDGYQVVVVWGELDPDFANAPILLAWADNGQPLRAQDGPLRLVVPTDKHGGRYVSSLASLEVRDVGAPTGA